MAVLPVSLPLTRAKAADIPSAGSPVAKAQTEGPRQTVEIKVKGSMCVACLKHLQSALASIAGVDSAKIDVDALIRKDESGGIKSSKPKHYATYQITFDTTRVSKSDIESFIKERDFRIFDVRLINAK